MLLDQLTVAEREQLLKLAKSLNLSAASIGFSAIMSAERSGHLPLSFAQQRLWFLAQMEGVSEAYHIPFSLRLGGTLDRVVLRRVLDRIVTRHEALRTTFATVAGEAVQQIASTEESRFHLLEYDLRPRSDASSELERLVVEEASTSFDLERGPLIRGRLIRLAEDEHVLLITMHHIVSDGWSMGVLFNELTALYGAYLRGEADPLPVLEIQYADYAVWQRQWIDGEILQQQAEYWKTSLAGAPALLELPTDHARPAEKDYAGAFARLELDARLTSGLKELSRRHGMTMYMTLLAGWVVLLARLSGQQDVVVGTPVANRQRAEVEGLIGFFVNTLALRLDVSGSPTVGELLEQVKGRALAAQEHQDIPFEQVVELVRPVRSLAHSPLFQVTFVWQNAPGGSLELPGLEVKPFRSSSRVMAKFDLTLTLQEAGQGIVGGIEYATSLFEPDTIERYLAYFRMLLEAMVADEAQAVDRLPMLPAAERRQVLYEWNDTRTDFPSDKCIHELFEEQVGKSPTATAVVFEEASLTYRELNRRANQLAHYLRELGVKPDSRVAICVERGLEMVVGLLAILKAGGAYVPLDPGYPVERLRFMLEDSTPMVLLTQAYLRELFPDFTMPVLDLDDAAAPWSDRPESNLDPASVGLTPAHLAYVIYTSGSTGVPKGVMVEHRGLRNTLLFGCKTFAVCNQDVMAALASSAFDISLLEIGTPWLAGACSVILSRMEVMDVERLIDRLQGVTILHTVPSLMRQVIRVVRSRDKETFPRALRSLLIGGESVAAELLSEMKEVFPTCESRVLYGPTEGTIICAHGEMTTVQESKSPIGRPIANAQVYILDGCGEPVPVGVAGELYIGGAGVARGYLNRAELTAERFLRDPFVTDAGARMYRTGDVGRWLPDGNIEFLGRNDDQVKIRGYRIELGEIEARLSEHPGVREAVVIAREDTPGDKRLVAYYTGAAAEELGAEALRAHLSGTLPEYMVPAAYVGLDHLPLTPNGKLDRKALPAPGGDAYATRGYEPPQGEIETKLAQIWMEVLKLDRVGRHDNFFELGGHSLLAVRLLTRIQQTLSVQVGIRDLFVHAVLSDFARELEGAAPAVLPAIVSAERSGHLPLSFAQQRLWFLAQMEGVSEAYHMPFSLRLGGTLDRVVLRRVLDRIVTRHEALRTTFAMVAGEAVQQIASTEESRFHLLEYDLRPRSDASSELERLVVEEASTSFDLERGPLIRGRLIRLAEDEHVLLITMHHIVSDGWSMGVLFNELTALYGAYLRGEADPLPVLEIQYADYAVWQRQWIDGEILQQQAEYWKTSLAGAPALLELPTDHARPAEKDYAGAFARLELDARLTSGLKELSRRHGMTMYMTLLAGWVVLLARLSGQQDVVVGTPVANRQRAEVEGLIGFFVNTLALRLDVSGSPTVGELLEQVKGRALAAQEHQDIPFEQVVELVRPVRSLAHSPLFQVTFVWQNAPGGSLELPGLEVKPFRSSSRVMAKFDLTLTLQEAGQGIVGGIEYATSLFEPDTIERYLAYFRMLLEAMVADEAQAVDRLPMLPAAERRQVLYEWNDTRTDFPSDKCIHELFEEQVGKSPTATAVVFEEASLTYRELNRRANQLAHYLRELGVKPDSRVAICVERGLEMVVGLLAILKAGGAYVPLDPGYPVERLRFMLEDSTPMVLLTQAYLRELFPDFTMPVLDLDDAAAPWSDRPESNLDPASVGLTPAHLAYVIYTSGSTGVPKGVMVEHRGLRNTLLFGCKTFAVCNQDVMAALASSAFDISLLEIGTPWLAGACSVILSRMEVMDVERLIDRLQGVTILHTVPSLMRQVIRVVRSRDKETFPRALRSLLIGGESVAAELLSEMKEVFPTCESRVLYGPTEGTIICAHGEMTTVQESKSPIGRPIANAQVYILDGCGEPVPVGVAGELYIGGAGVARGYLNRAELTAERFLRDPFVTDAGARMYRTGDVGRWLPDGNIEFLGRNDDQVKIRGYRIELGEIEARLSEHPGVREAVVIAREDTPGDKRLVAYYTGAAAEELGAEALRAHLSGTLPEYMVPAAYVGLDHLPLTPNGKLDRKALPAPGGDAYATRGYEPPQGEIETKLAQIWMEVLKLDRVGRHDNFFELGGHSLLAVRLLTRIQQTLSVQVGIRDLFVHAVLSDFARELEGAAPAVLPAIVSAERSGHLPLSFAQQRLWFLAQMEGVSEAYHMPFSLRLGGTLDRVVLRRVLDRIVTRHEALRTTFAMVAGEAVQQIASTEESRFHLLEYDLRPRSDASSELERLVVEEASTSFDLERGPLIRGRLIRLAEDEHVLLITMHHIVSDGWSMGVLFNELTALYGAYLRGEADPLPVLEIQYADYAVWQRQWIDGEILQQQAEYWKTSLAGAPALLELPTDHARPAEKDYAGAFARLELDARLTSGLKELSRRHGMTMYMTLLAGWVVLLARLSGQQDVVVGTPVANRQRAEVEGLIGFFVNTLALRLDVSGSPTVGELLEQVKGRALAAQEHQDIPFEQVVELVRPVRSLAHSPLFQVTFVWQNAPGGSLELPGLEVKPFRSSSRVMAKFDLTLTLQEAGQGIVGGIEYATSLFEPDTIERYLAYFRMLLEAMVADEAQAVDRLQMLPAAERRQVLYEWNDTRTDFPSDKCIHELFEEQVGKSPTATAVVFEEASLTYRELNRRANQLAHYLRELGVKPDSRVAICAERGLEMVVGLLAILKAGGAYVPLDPGYPVERLRFMLEDSTPMVLLTQAYLRELFPDFTMPVLDLDDAAAPWSDRPESNLDPASVGLTSAHLAYVIYTSGSTGVPKGVMVEHANITNYLFWADDTYYHSAGFGSPVNHSIGFDGIVTTFFGPIVSGQTLMLLRQGTEMESLAYRGSFGVDPFTLVKVTPSHLKLLNVAIALDEIKPLTRTLMIGGEALVLSDVLFWQRRFPDVRLVNHFGPTETTVGCCTFEISTPITSVFSIPIGRPIANAQVYILDGCGEPVPVGVAGELYIGGAGVARGYLNRAELTAERFLRDPFVTDAGARMYRTGDVGRWLPDGNIEFLGRNDDQVKIRGYRIELGEIEARLSEHPGVREAVVVAREDTPGDKRLVAYYTGAAAEELGAEALRAHLSGTLPEYMVPAAYVGLDHLPLTPNGKLDRKALPAPGGDAYATRGYEPPQGEIETKLAQIWMEVLKLDRVGRHDNFFELGGHSLLAVRLLTRIQQTLSVQVGIRDLFVHAVLSDFARELEGAAPAVLPAIVSAERSGHLPLSFAQQRLWFLAQMEGVSEAYHIPFSLRLGGTLDRVVLRRVLDRIVTRHEALRTTFATVAGEAVQQIASTEESRFHLLEYDLRPRSDASSELERLVVEEASTSFDLERGPLIRGRLIRLAEDEHVLLITMHHIVSDGWSMGVLFNELTALYGAYLRGEADPLPVLEIQYADYAVWQRQWIDGEILQQQAEYWKTSLAGAPALLELPTDHARPAEKDYAGAFARLELDARLTSGLKELSRRHGMTMYMTLLAGWVVLLARLSGQQDVVVGTPVANRQRAEVEGLIGFFVNTLALRLDVSGSPTVGELLEQVKGRALAAQEHQDIPFEQVVELVRPVRSLAHSPLFQVTFVWQNAPGGSLELPGLEVKPFRSSSRVMAKFDLTLTLQEAGQGIVGGIEYATSLFEPDTIERYLAYFRMLLEAMVADEAQAVDRLQMLPAAERRQVLYEWNDTRTDFPSDKCIHELFEEQVGKSPTATAVVFEEASLTYRELNRRANQLAHYLRELGVKPDSRVAICVERGLEMVVGLLAILKAGGAYVPLDPGYPVERLRFMLEDSTPMVLLTQAYLRELFPDFTMPVLDLDDAAAPWSDRPESNLDPASVGLTSAHLAYVIYTSGSTGVPKGVMVEHASVCNLSVAQIQSFVVESDSRILQFASFSFDACVSEIFMALCQGATLHIRGQWTILAGQTLTSIVSKHRITHITLPPAVLAALSEHAQLDSVCTLIVAGDILNNALARHWARARHLINAYGPTEVAVCATLHSCDAEESSNPPIGRPIANAQVYILDGCGEPVPVGVAGELYIGGAGVARGYLNRAELTAERFLRDPFVTDAGARMYRTGDVGRWLPDGNIEFLGRNDDQVKIRGYRIELGEIEARLSEHPGVREAVVVAREDTPGDKRLVAYYTGAAAEELGAEALRAHLSGTLPEYMVPAAYVGLDHLPLTPNGKLDRKALPAPGGDAYATRGYEPPQGEIETKLAQIWMEVLKLDRVGRHDNFFELGGHSLLAVRLLTRIQQTLSVQVGIRDLFVHAVLSDFARELEGAAPAVLPAIVSAERSGHLPLSFAQQRLWFLAQMEGVSEAYHIPFSLRLGGTLDRVVLRRVLDRIVTRHEALRTTFAMVAGEAVQQIASTEESRFHLLEYDLRPRSDASSELERLVVEEASTSFDLERGPLIRGRLIRLAEDEHVLLITMHHIVSDGWSMGVLLNELTALYGAYLRGEADPLPVLEIQYADYAVWQRQWIDGEILQQQAEYWKTSLAGAPALLELPTDHARPAEKDYAGAFARLELDARLTSGLKELSRRHGMTMYMTLLAGWVVLLARLSGQQDVVVGTPVANRQRAEVEGLIGFFVNTLALRLDVSGSPTVGELLEQVKGRALAAQEHQDIPFEQVVELVRPVRSLAHSPLFQVMFAWQNAPGGSLELPGLEVKPFRSSSRVMAKFDLTLTLQEAGQGIVGGIEYATSLFEPATIERYLAYFRMLLEAMVADEAQAVDRLQMLPAAERRQVLYEWNDTRTDFPSDKCIHELFEEQVGKSPTATAVVFEEASLTYRELNRRANQLAHYLRELGVKPDSRVAICAERGLEMVVGLLAILKAGGAYVPLDPGYPVERLRFMLEDSTPMVLLTQAYLRELFPDFTMPVLDLDDAAAPWSDRPESNLDPASVGLTSAHLAYVIYTSGSTGVPKGVMVEHANITRLFAITNAWFQFDASDVWTLFHSYAFDFSVWEIFGALLYGGSLMVVPGYLTRAPEDFYSLLCQTKVTVLNQTPSAFRQLITAQANSEESHRLRYVIFGGEALEVATLRPWYEQNLAAKTQLINMYGLTETTVHATYRTLKQADISKRVGSPIGCRIPDLRTYILDGCGEPVPVGVAGELYIGGAGVARGYLNRAELTAERFLRDPFVTDAGARMYRTGDVGRWLPDGNIEFLGRNDDQVKIRGYRIELGEIEARLSEHPGVREAVVIAREDTPGDKRLVAYYTGAAAEELGAEALRAHLSGTLPEYMVPAAIVFLDHLPLTPNGKLDRKALPAPGGDAYATRGYEPPQGEIETKLAQIWMEVLKLGRVGRHDNFFELGGHSLLAVRVLSRLREALGIEIAISHLFSNPILSDFARNSGGDADAMLPPITHVNGGERMPLSYAQQRLWFIDRLEGGKSTEYNMPVALLLRGELDLEALTKTINTIVARHASLRTHFADIEGKAVQVIESEVGVDVPVEDLSGMQEEVRQGHVDRHLQAEVIEPFDLSHGPLVRMKLLKLGDQKHILLRTVHHIVSDGWSEGVFNQEFGILYEAYREKRENPLEPLAVQYADYALWQRDWLQTGKLDEGLRYWKEQLAGAPALLELPTDRIRSPIQTFLGKRYIATLPEHLTDSLKRLSTEHQATLYMTLLSALSVLLSRYSRQNDIVVGTPIANRRELQMEQMIGFFVNTLVMRVKVNGEKSFRKLLEDVRRTSLDAYQYQDIPFERLVEELSPERKLNQTPIFQVVFALQNAPQVTPRMSGLEMDQVLADDLRVRFDLEVHAREHEGQIRFTWLYNQDLFDPWRIEQMARQYLQILGAIAADTDQKIEQIDMLPAAERRQVLYEWNDTRTDFPSDKCIHELFEEQVGKSPTATAVVFEEASLTYRELNRRANQLAHYLRELGVKPDSRVAICVERGLEMVVGLLAILKAGGAYVPLDPGYPVERLRFMLEDSTPMVLLTQAYLRELFPDFTMPVLDLDDAAAPWSDRPESNLDPASVGLTSAHLAYVIYTSGSTGRPKGVMVEHRNAVNFISWGRSSFASTILEFTLFSTSLNFDLAVFELFVPITTGNTVGIVRDVLHIPLDVTIINTVPSAMSALLETDKVRKRVRAVNLAGEPLKKTLVDHIFAATEVETISNLYGPTETTTYSTWAVMQRGKPFAMHIGRPIANAQVYILDGCGEPVPVGVAGELYIGGAGVARGYLNRAELTAERFLRDPFVTDAGARMYRTGDVGRWLPDGNIEFLGRNDDQVKIRGYRIELGEIEARLSEHPGVREAVVVAREDTPGDKRLVAYVINQESTAEQSMFRASHISGWQRLFETTYVQANRLSNEFNITGWNSSYTGEPIPASEMLIWVEETVARLRALKPSQVLEIGCGTGLLLTRLAEECERYIGVDFSASVLRQLQMYLDTRVDYGHVELSERMAHDLSFLADDSVDLVILNSVVQYFPDMAYLLQVLKETIRVTRRGGHVFVGDVRNLQLLEAYYTSVELYKADEEMLIADLRNRILHRQQKEEELVVDPALFEDLGRRWRKVGRVEKWLKAGAFDNELSRFRYDVVIKVGNSQVMATPEHWVNWEDTERWKVNLKEILSLEPDITVGVRGIREARGASSVEAYRLLMGEISDCSTARQLREVCQHISGEDPDAVTQMAKDIGVSFCWQSFASTGLYDGIFNPKWNQIECAGEEDADHYLQYGNKPVRSRGEDDLGRALREYLRTKLPEYMVPEAYVRLETLPLTTNGKIDRKALPPPELNAHSVREYDPPRGETETKLAEMWAELLKVERVGRHDNFFELGGHSLLAVMLIERMRQQGMNADVRALFATPTLMELAETIGSNVAPLLEVPANRIPTLAEISADPAKIRELRI